MALQSNLFGKKVVVYGSNYIENDWSTMWSSKEGVGRFNFMIPISTGNSITANNVKIIDNLQINTSYANILDTEVPNWFLSSFLLIPDNTSATGADILGDFVKSQFPYCIDLRSYTQFDTFFVWDENTDCAFVLQDRSHCGVYDIENDVYTGNNAINHYAQVSYNASNYAAPVVNCHLTFLNGVTHTNLMAGDCIYGPLNGMVLNYRGAIGNVGVLSLWGDFWDGAIENYQPQVIDPYEPAGISGTGGGQGTFGDTGDDIDFPSLPTLSAVDTGFITLFNPSLAELRNLASYMWGTLFDLSVWKKIFADPMDAILGLSIVPVAVSDAGAANVTVGNISTGISMNKAASQYVEVDCGSITIPEYWGAYLDYDPYTKIEIFLPYCGIHPLATDDVMNKTVHVKYHVDVLSGACCAYVKCGNSVLYSFVGQCSSSVPITGNDWTNVINGVISASTAIGSMVATGGASAPSAIPELASTIVNNFKPSVEKSGSMSSTGGMLAIQTPYLIMTRPRQALPASQNAFEGYPSFITMYLSDVTGYTEVNSIHLEGIPGTDIERSEIEGLLKSGVIL